MIKNSKSDNPRCSTRDENSQPSWPFSQDATASRNSRQGSYTISKINFHIFKDLSRHFLDCFQTYFHMTYTCQIQAL